VRSPRLATVLFAGTLATILGMVFTGAARADVTPDPNWNEIFAPGLNTQSNTLCFDVPNGTGSIGTTIQLYHCHGYDSNGAPQRWRFIPFTTDADGEAAYLIENMGNHLCLSYTPGNGDFFFVSQDSCLDSQSNLVHLWVIRSENPSGTDPNFMLDSVTWNASTGVYDNGHCISASNASDANRTRLVLVECTSFQDPQEVFSLG
jgi:hypothetical protein